MISLLLSFVALCVGPIVYRAVRERQGALNLLDGFIFVSMGGIIFLSVVPEIAVVGGWWTALFVFVGLIGPTMMEKHVRGMAMGSHYIALVLGLVGLCLHAFTDGAALTHSVHDGAHTVPKAGVGGHGHTHLASAIVLHRIPVGLTIWWLLRPTYGRRTAMAFIGCIALSTGLGYFVGEQFMSGFSGQGTAWFQALVAGSLLHVVFHRQHTTSECCGDDHRQSHDHDTDELVTWKWHRSRPEGIGGFIALVVVLSALGSEFFVGEDRVVRAFLGLALQSAPALFAGFALAGLVSACLPKSSMRWLGRGSGIVQAVRGMVLGLPIPICSCGVVPLYRALIERGAPATAAMAFLIATPELGLDAIFLSISLLGGPMTALRVVAAGVVALLVGWIVGRIVAPRPSGANNVSAPVSSKSRPLGLRLVDGLKTGFGEVVDHTAPWILLGLVIAALCEPLLAEGWLRSIPFGLDVLLFALLGVPTYVCASGATPLVAVLIFNGLSPGAALAFLLTGPATNVTTFGVLASLHGRRVALVFSLVMIAGAVALGLVANWVFPSLSVPATSVAESATTLHWVCLVALALAFIFSMLRRGPRRFAAEIFTFDQSVPHPHSHAGQL